ncbi:dephospho-CoA kinase [Alteromonas ponticola]|uniref:Dephospho-CoA kinase n=1 Tax=Alteromonas aquimaris TaxID=2998417 RepID=A0ABT3P2U0_9ALTE|nr:dephospho-CoA kinase [Alteromonas aquimaris]MCW8107079.1 dephospho-CoA kinase [Alteromonas aquimaris]
MPQANKYVVGLTGGIGSGKSVVSQEFEKLGIDVIDADVVARDVVKTGTPVLNEIAAHFGSEVLHSDGSLNRALLRQRVFNDDAEKRWLNGLIHPAVREQMMTAIQHTTSPYCVLAVPLLIENNLTTMVDRVLVVDCPETLQIERASRRDGSDSKLIENIMRAQISRKERIKAADDIILNDGPLNRIPFLVKSLHSQYLSFSATKR